ncbi:MGH1-like glycoside hydrolase domain-containing protein, partial [Bauldia litoralis]
MEDTKLDLRAKEILRTNDRGGYTVPTAGLYPYQWNWDSAFVALGFAAFDIDRAWTEVESLLASQWPDGMVPHIIFQRIDDSYFPGP